MERKIETGNTSLFLSISVISGGDTSYFSKEKPATGNIGVGFCSLWNGWVK